MVVGRNLGKIEGDLKGLPNESYDLIRHELIFREIEDQVLNARKVHKGSLELGTKQWIAEQGRINEEANYQMTMNRLAAIGEKVKVARDKDISLDIVGAINLFHAKSNEQLLYGCLLGLIMYFLIRGKAARYQ
jgi:hypothetical protein